MADCCAKYCFRFEVQSANKKIDSKTVDYYITEGTVLQFYTTLEQELSKLAFSLIQEIGSAAAKDAADICLYMKEKICSIYRTAILPGVDQNTYVIRNKTLLNRLNDIVMIPTDFPQIRDFGEFYIRFELGTCFGSVGKEEEDYDV